MDVLIMPTAMQVQGGKIRVQFAACGVLPDGVPMNLTFALDYAYGASLAQKTIAINNAAKAAFEASYGISVPVGTRSEIIGIQ